MCEYTYILSGLENCLAVFVFQLFGFTRWVKTAPVVQLCSIVCKRFIRSKNYDNTSVCYQFSQNSNQLIFARFLETAAGPQKAKPSRILGNW